MTNPMLAELDELEPCPFCGREPAVRIPTDKDGFAVHVSCRCGAQLYGRNRHFAGEQEAIAAWNRRTHATLADMAKRLEAAERDAARIDWLESKAHMLTWNDNAEHVAIRAEDGAEGTGESWREAIDAAIDATQEGEG